MPQRGFVVDPNPLTYSDVMTISKKIDGDDFCSVAFSDNQVSTGYPIAQQALLLSPAPHPIQC